MTRLGEFGPVWQLLGVLVLAGGLIAGYMATEEFTEAVVWWATAVVGSLWCFWLGSLSGAIAAIARGVGRVEDAPKVADTV